jgi:uncharacterized membrane protein
MKVKTKHLVTGALIAAMYVVLTLIANALGLASNPVQVRLSEALTILPVFTPAAIPGLFIGCLLANYITGCAVWDIIFGSLATLLGAIGTYYLRKNKYLAAASPILANTVIVPFILQYVYQFEGGIGFFFFTVCAGEIISAGVLGLLLHQAIARTKISDMLE